MNTYPEHAEISSSKPLIACAAALLFAASSAFAQAPAPAGGQHSFLAEDLHLLTAKVTAIDAAKRLITLRGPGGREETVEAGPDVRNFAQLKVGQDVDIQYYQSLAADLTTAPASTTHDAVVMASRATEGSSPAGAAGLIYTAVVTVDAVDAAKGTVFFTGPGGMKRETMAESDAGRSFIAQLKAGDRVLVTYGEAFAVSVAPAAK